MEYQGYTKDQFEKCIQENSGIGKLCQHLKKLEDSLDKTRLELTVMSIKYDYNIVNLEGFQ